MLTPKEKAKELFKKFYQPIFDIDLGINVSQDEKRYEAAKQCAIIAVGEIISIKLLWFQKNTKELDYWREIKKEIEKL